MEVRKWQVRRQPQRPLKGVIVLSGKPHHDIRPQPQIRDLAQGALDEVSIFVRRIRPVHGRQDPIVSALKRNMEIGAEGRGRRHQIEQLIRDRRGFNRRNTDTFQAGHLFQPPDHRAEVGALLPVLADIHAGQHHFAHALCGKLFRLAHNIAQDPAALMAARKGNDAEAAHRTAPVLNLQRGTGGIRLGIPGQLEIVPRDRLRAMHLGRRPLFQLAGRRQESGQIELVLVADNEIDAVLVLQALHAGLRITAGHGHKGMGRMFERLANEIARRPLGIFRDGTGVQHQQIRRLAKLDQFIAVPAQPFAQQGGFRLVEAAAQRVERRARWCGVRKHPVIIGEGLQHGQGSGEEGCAD